MRGNCAQKTKAKEVQIKILGPLGPPWGCQHTGPLEGMGRTFSGSLRHGALVPACRRIRNTRAIGCAPTQSQTPGTCVAFPPRHRDGCHQPLAGGATEEPRHRCLSQINTTPVLQCVLCHLSDNSEFEILSRSPPLWPPFSHPFVIFPALFLSG